MANRLITETSPYLLQHAHNPVDWYPWGDDALQRAKDEDKPIMLSVGYAACHWCHVMERESFEDVETARIMNERFINIKVDREERPDVDSIYMQAVQAMTGRGGWPMTVFLTPGGNPFYGGTYFPLDDQHGMPSFKRVLMAVHDAYINRRADLEQQSAELTDHIARASRLNASLEPMDEQILREAARTLIGEIDAEWGGFGSGMKFPQPMNLDFLLRMHLRDDTPGALDAVTLTLDRMARGGIFDHVGGGFHRYAVDRVWLVPHFEKMLYDNALLIRLYARAWQVTGSPLYRETAIRTGEWMVREMQHGGGGFFSSLDADSEGVEGKFYVWPFEEIIAIAGDDMPLAVAAFALSGHGNWEGTNVLWRPEPDDEVAARAGVGIDELRAAVDRVTRLLLDARATRVRPGTDDKVLAGWNGLAIAGLAEAGRTFGRDDFVDAAARAAEFVLTAMRAPDGRVVRAWREGRASGEGFLEDQAMMADGCLTLYETTFDPRWWHAATDLGRRMVAHFADLERGGFFDTADDGSALIVRPKDLFDNALPCGNSAAADVLLRLAALAGDANLERAATGAMRLITPLTAHSPGGFGNALGAIDRYLGRAVEIAIVGDLSAAPVGAMIEVAYRGYLPNRVVAVGAPGATEPALLQDRPSKADATAYVCRDFMCEAPVTDPSALAEVLYTREAR